MKKTFLWCMAVCLLVFISCSRDDSNEKNEGDSNDGGNNPTSSIVLPIQINSQFNQHYAVYNGDKIVEFGNMVKAKFTYNEDLISKIVSLGTYDFSYDSQKRLTGIKFTSVKVLDRQMLTEYKFVYLNNNKVNVTITNTSTEKGKVDDTFTNITEREYILDDKGQVLEDKMIKIAKNPSKKLYITKYQYDDKNSPLKNIKGFDKLTLAKDITILDNTFSLEMGVINNLVSKTTESIPHDILYDEKRNYTYEYNDAGYPINAKGVLIKSYQTKEDYKNSYKYNQ